MEAVKERLIKDPQYRRELLERVLPQFAKLNEQFANSFLYKLKYSGVEEGGIIEEERVISEKDGPEGASSAKTTGNSRATYAILETINRNLNSGKR